MASPEKARLSETQTCPICQGTGWRPVEDAGPEGSGRRVMRCSCVVEARQPRLFEAARIPPQYQHCDFEHFWTNIYEQRGYNESLQQAKLLAQRFAEESPVNVECGLLFMGPCGAGKTHLAVATLRRLLEKGLECLYCDYQDLLKQIQASYNPVAETTEMQVLEPILTAPVLLLDDLGSIKPSLWVLDTVGYVLNQRYSHKRMTLITSNYLDPPEGSPARTGEASAARRRAATGSLQREDSLEDRIGYRIRSRLYEMCRLVHIQADDFRRRVKQADYRY